MAFALLLAGCATATGPAGTSPSGSTFRATGSATPAAPSEDYRVGANDILDITVFRVPDLSKEVQVSGSGQIALPLIGAVSVAGKTVTEVEAELTRRLAADYLQSPQVSVLVKEAVSQRITLEGQVKNPGLYPTTGRTTLLQAIALAGGMSDLADERGVVVFRNVDGTRHVAVFDYRSIRSGRKEDPLILGGDIITVDASGVKATMQGLRQSVGVVGLFLPML